MEEEALLANLKTRKEQVTHILRYYPRARSNDFYLQILWLRIFAKIKLPWIPIDQVEQYSGTLETIRRVRQKIQNEDGLFRADDQTIVNRYEKAEAFRQVIGRV